MRYYKMMYNGNLAHDKGFVMCKKANLDGVSQYIIYRGKKISDQEWSADISFHYDSSDGCVLTNWLNNVYRWELFSDRLIKILDPIVQSSVQYLPVNVFDGDLRIAGGQYQVMNVLDVMPFSAFLKEKAVYSTVEVNGKAIYSIVKYAFSEKELQNHHIFRLENDMVSLFVSEKVRKVIRENEFKEFSFLEVLTV